MDEIIKASVYKTDGKMMQHKVKVTVIELFLNKNEFCSSKD